MTHQSASISLASHHNNGVFNRLVTRSLIAEDLTVNDDLTVGGDVDVTGDVSAATFTSTGLASLNSLHVTGTTASTSPTTGVLTVAGGEGILGDLWVRGAGHFGATGSVSANGPYLEVSGGGTAGTETTLLGTQTANITLTLPGGAVPDTLVGRATTDTLTNKTLTSATNTITATSLFSGGNTVNVAAAGIPTVGQVLTATSGTAATWQTPTAGALGYGYAFGLAPNDYAATVAIAAPFPIPQDGVFAGSVSRSSATALTLAAIGVYMVTFHTTVAEAAQIALFMNGAQVANTVVGRAVGQTELVLHALLTTVAINAVIDVRNNTSGSALTVTLIAGGTDSVSTSLTVLRLA